MNKMLLAALGLVTALAFSVPTLQITSADAATHSKSMGKKSMHHSKACKATPTHKCPVAKKKKK